MKRVSFLKKIFDFLRRWGILKKRNQPRRTKKNKNMQTYFDADGNKTCNSLTKSSWERIYSAGSHKKVAKGRDCGPWVSKMNERRVRTLKAIARKKESDALIEKYSRASKKYLYLSVHERAKLTYASGVPTVIVRNIRGHFTGERVEF